MKIFTHDDGFFINFKPPKQERVNSFVLRVKVFVGTRHDSVNYRRFQLGNLNTAPSANAAVIDVRRSYFQRVRQPT